jgi:hypothetical protein
MLTQARLKELLHYSPETGEFVWLVRTANRIKVGNKAGSSDNRGYVVTMIDGKTYKNHRLAFLYMEGSLPSLGVDHINGLKNDNSWANLRQATQAQNTQNMALPRNNTTGFKGVSWHECTKSYTASVTAFGKRNIIHNFPTKELASEFACLMREILHGKFARHS